MMTFDQLATCLLPTGTLTNPSELHGMFCGRLCGGQRLSRTDLADVAADLLGADKALAGSLTDPLATLHETTLTQLRDSGFVFQLLLPDDDDPLEMRTQSLAAWCQGFLAGLGLSGLAGETRLSADTNDAIRDLAAIAQADEDPDDNEENEASFFELVEYVRMATLLVFADVEQPGAATDTPSVH